MVDKTYNFIMNKLDEASVKKAIKENAKPRKWVCVEAEEVIVDKIIDCNYKATFKRNEYINNLSIKTYTVTEEEKELYIKGVSTNPDECKGVE